LSECGAVARTLFCEVARSFQQPQWANVSFSRHAELDPVSRSTTRRARLSQCGYSSSPPRPPKAPHSALLRSGRGFGINYCRMQPQNMGDSLLRAFGGTGWRSYPGRNDGVGPSSFANAPLTTKFSGRPSSSLMRRDRFSSIRSA